ncbi:MAG: class I SAM-dependent methyltransferase [Desulfosalsimonadaceae bacterium]|nr:class I SAM-dependent methyltransferase [Desulfosalsimonadaceae bacterium]
MKKNHHSRTAVSAAVVRAFHTAFETPVVFDDPYAGRLAGPVWQKISGLRLCYWFGTRIIYSGLDPIRRQIVARARYAEDKLEAAAAAGINQYVIIGAGFDSFAFRRTDLTGNNLSVFELDHPASQRAKKSRLRKLRLALPEKHEFVGIDFESEGLCEALADSSFSRKHPAFFSWLGTVHYLTPQAVIATLNAIAACAGRGSELVLDYSGPEGLAAASDQKMVKQLKRYTDRRGEPMLSTFEPQQFRQIVSQAGFQLLETISPEEQASRYFTLPNGKTQPMPGSYFAHLRRS